MADSNEKFINYNGLLKLISLIKQYVVGSINWKSNRFVSSVEGDETDLSAYATSRTGTYTTKQLNHGGAMVTNNGFNYWDTTDARGISTTVTTVDSNNVANADAAISALKTLSEANKSAINSLASTGLKREIVTQLPTIGIQTNVIYLILASDDPLNDVDPSSTTQNNNAYNEYMYINNAWERIGSTEVNLDIDPITNNEVDTAWANTPAAT